jgi:hypothetical protein
MAGAIPQSVWRRLYLATFVYGTATVVVLWLFTRAYTF